MVDVLAASEFQKMSTAEQILLVQDLWDRIAEVPEQVPLTSEQRAELDRRLADHAARPDDGAPWDEVRERIRNAT